jgi:hypothetical protein
MTAQTIFIGNFRALAERYVEVAIWPSSQTMRAPLCSVREQKIPSAISAVPNSGRAFALSPIR